MNRIRQHLGWKLFLSYLIIIIVGVISLALAADIQTPLAFQRHMISMEGMMDGEMGSMMTDLTDNFQRAINEVSHDCSSGIRLCRVETQTR